MNSGTGNYRIVFAFVVTVAMVLLVNGALPFFMTPTLGQAVWTTGFSAAFIEGSTLLPGIYANSIGIPEPAPIAFGLSGAWPTAVLMNAGFDPWDAYTLMVAAYLSLASFAAYRLAIRFKVGRMRALLGVLAWGTMPIIWRHSGYSMLSLGIALLPAYLLSALALAALCRNQTEGFYRRLVPTSLLYIATCVLSVFMDGYTFVMFAAGASGLLACLLDLKAPRRTLISVLAVHSLGLGAAYGLYSAYIGSGGWPVSPIGFFRAFGVDVSFLLRPTEGVLWLADRIGFSVTRRGVDYFGDASVWTSTFLMPVLIAAATGLLTSRRSREKTAFALCFVFSIYLALGPSLKFDSTRPEGVSAGNMPAEHAVAATGSALLYEKVPGLNNMRATYRWTALSVFSLWTLAVLGMGQSRRRWSTALATTLMAIVVVFNLPNLRTQIATASANHAAFRALESEFVGALREATVQGDVVAFLPHTNDVLVNYAVPRADLRSFNIGGDKNMSLARRSWPESMQQFRNGTSDPYFSVKVVTLLLDRVVDAIVLPYVDLLWAAHKWPYPADLRSGIAGIEEELLESGVVQLDRGAYFSVVRMLEQYDSPEDRRALKLALVEALCLPPLCIGSQDYDRRVYTRVGRVQDGLLLTTGKAGVLHFGPYARAESGIYDILLEGVLDDTTGAYVDVVSRQGRETHAKALLDLGQREESVLRLSGIRVGSPVTDLEVRVFVSDASKMALRSIKMIRQQASDIR
ncbi:MAG: hypothetical protein AAFY29_20190 [Pseudomonadota bacterium]